MSSSTDCVGASAAHQNELRVVEFYSGIGGMHYGLKYAAASENLAANVVAAFDINPVANHTYEYNFGKGVVRKNNIERVAISVFDDFKAALWMLAPPCQPYTRQGLKKDAKDARASSFLSLLDRIPQMRSPPQYIIIENVVGFERSMTRDLLTKTLCATGYRFQEFVLGPQHFGIPYSRPRYFCVARTRPFPVDKLFDAPWTCRPSYLLAACRGSVLDCSPQESILVRPISEFLEASPTCALPIAGPSTSSLQTTVASLSRDVMMCEPSSREDDPWGAYRVREEVLDKTADCIDVVTDGMHDVNCFTKAYGKYVKGTGSVLATQNLHLLNTFADWAHREPGGMPMFEAPLCGNHQGMRTACAAGAPTLAGACPGVQPDAPAIGDEAGHTLGVDAGSGCQAAAHGQSNGAQDADCEAADTCMGSTDAVQRGKAERRRVAEAMKQLGLRHFTPREISNLHSFPPDFSFPPDLTLRQRYACLGNSLSVAVVADLMRYLLDGHKEGSGGQDTQDADYNPKMI